MKSHHFERVVTLDRSRHEVFPFFADAANLEVLTPSNLRFEVLTPDVVMRESAEIDYRLRLGWVSLGWRSRIVAWEPPERFVDAQMRGPYREWVHEHAFRDVGGRTEMRDRVRYSLPLGPLGALALPWVRRRLGRIFDYRAEVITELFPRHDARGPGATEQGTPDARTRGQRQGP